MGLPEQGQLSEVINELRELRDIKETLHQVQGLMKTQNELLRDLNKELARVKGGTEKVRETLRCSECRGTGKVLGPSNSGYRMCPACNGKGH